MVIKIEFKRSGRELEPKEIAELKRNLWHLMTLILIVILAMPVLSLFVVVPLAEHLTDFMAAHRLIRGPFPIIFALIFAFACYRLTVFGCSLLEKYFSK